MQTNVFREYDGRELHVINDVLLPMVLRKPSHIPVQDDQLAVGYEELAMHQCLLSSLKPKLSLEVGTFQGQTFSLIAEYSEHAISVDPDPSVKQKLGPLFSNAEFITATSDEALPELVSRFNDKKLPLEFVFVDGNHSKEFVRRDINNLLAYQPITKTVILMHDSFNPECREGIATANWKQCDFCHFVELDFVPGIVHPDHKVRGQLWGGLAMALLLPEHRKGELHIRRTHELAFRAASGAQLSSWWRKLLRIS
jgi:hypothetical protein